MVKSTFIKVITISKASSVQGFKIFFFLPVLRNHPSFLNQKLTFAFVRGLTVTTHSSIIYVDCHPGGKSNLIDWKHSDSLTKNRARFKL